MIRSSKDVVYGWTTLKSSIDVSMDDDQETLHDPALHTVGGRMYNAYENPTYQAVNKPLIIALSSSSS